MRGHAHHAPCDPFVDFCISPRWRAIRPSAPKMTETCCHRPPAGDKTLAGLKRDSVGAPGRGRGATDPDPAGPDARPPKRRRVPASPAEGSRENRSLYEMGQAVGHGTYGNVHVATETNEEGVTRVGALKSINMLPSLASVLGPPHVEPAGQETRRDRSGSVQGERAAPLCDGGGGGVGGDRGRGATDVGLSVMFREFSALTACSHHPNIVAAHALCPLRGIIFMELMDGTLATVIRMGQGQRVPLLPRIVTQLLSALAFLHHSLGIAHRDIKHANVLFSVRGGCAGWGPSAPAGRGGSEEGPTIEVRIADFGLSRAFDLSSLSSARNGPSSRLADLMGPLSGDVVTNAYKPPEILFSRMRSDAEAFFPYDPRAVDLWSMGMLFLELAVGGFPFAHLSGDTLVDELKRVVPLAPYAEPDTASPPVGVPAFVRSRCPESPRWLATIAERMLAAVPRSRPSSFALLSEAVAMIAAAAAAEEEDGTRRAAPDRVGEPATAFDLANVPKGWHPRQSIDPYPALPVGWVGRDAESLGGCARSHRWRAVKKLRKAGKGAGLRPVTIACACDALDIYVGLRGVGILDSMEMVNLTSPARPGRRRGGAKDDTDARRRVGSDAKDDAGRDGGEGGEADAAEREEEEHAVSRALRVIAAGCLYLSVCVHESVVLDEQVYRFVVEAGSDEEVEGERRPSVVGIVRRSAVDVFATMGNRIPEPRAGGAACMDDEEEIDDLLEPEWVSEPCRSAIDRILALSFSNAGRSVASYQDSHTRQVTFSVSGSAVSRTPLLGDGAIRQPLRVCSRSSPTAVRIPGPVAPLARAEGARVSHS